MTADNEKAVYACVNFGQAGAPKDIRERSIIIDGDIRKVLEDIK